EIRSFLGLAGYYHRFIPDFSKIAKPMTKLLQKEAKFNWTSDCEAAFQKLKTLLTTAPVLTQPDVTKPFDVYCDASGTGLGCVDSEFSWFSGLLPPIHSRFLQDCKTHDEASPEGSQVQLDFRL